jgi:3-phosphoshikimate 1-carboxyvinyltransferase
LKVKIQTETKKLSGNLKLTGSKSISNRLLILQALSGKMSPLSNLSNSDDTTVMLKALSTKEGTIDIGIAGTAMRFLTAYLAIQDADFILTGASRMKERPIKDLVDALRSLGADIGYLEKDGYPPLSIKGKKLIGGALSIKADTSSQFISAILMISPYFEKGIQLQLVGEVLSRPYIEMTLNLMQRQGVNHEWVGDTITVLPGAYTDHVSEVESDWSSISYVFELAALSESAEISLERVDQVSVQGDQEGMNYFKKLGIDSSIDNGVLTIRKQTDFIRPELLEFDCTKTPDLAQTLAATTCALGIPMNISGLKSLPIKETDRLMALKVELEKCGAQVTIVDNEALEIIPGSAFLDKDFTFETYGDHRMALCLAPLALVSNSVTLNNPRVVNKSYKSYWDDLTSLGFDVQIS